MALTPSYNYNFAAVSYNNNLVIGEQPKTAQYQLDTAEEGKSYIMGMLLAATATPGLLKMFDYTSMTPERFMGVFFDDTVTDAQIATGFVNVAVKDGMMTMWDYESLVGANATQTDIDYLITNDYAVKRYVNGQDVVQFGVIGKGVYPA